MQRRIPPGPVDTPLGKLATANAGFSFDLYKELGKKDQHSNLFFSPSSISVALSMTYLGAKENTASEMRKTLKFEGIEDESLHASFLELLGAYDKNHEGVKLHMANRLYAEKSFDIIEQYLEDTKKFYRAELSQVSFVTDFEGARQDINRWVEEKTVSKIKDILPSGSLDALTRLVLVNAVYFKGDWKSQFDPSRTEQADFNTITGDKVKVQMMYQKKQFVYGVNNTLHAQVIEIPYLGDTMSLIIMLPEPGKFEHFEQNITLEDIVSCEKSFRMHSCDVHLWLPRFRLEDSFSLADTLTSMGMVDVFSESKANLSGIDKTNNIFVSKVLHKAFLEINEEGSEAAAATAVVMQMRCMPRIFEFRVDKPCMFFIRENTSRSILFMGRFVKPSP